MSENQNIINENVVEKAEKQVRVKPTPDANFDWNCDPKKDDNYKSEERMRLEAMYEKTMSQIGDHEVIEGTVVANAPNPKNFKNFLLSIFILSVFIFTKIKD